MESLCALHWGGEDNNHIEWFLTQINKRQAAQKDNDGQGESKWVFDFVSSP